MDEFELIGRYFLPLSTGGQGVHLGIGDDCALVEIPPGQQLAVTTDTLVAGRHFPRQTTAFDIGWKALAVNLSDLAAMGAEPRWFSLALTMPEADPAWLAGLAEGLGSLARQHGVALIGGDTTRGELSLSITAMGLVPPALALRRAAARVGDCICVTGTLGDAALGLARLQAPDAVPPLPASDECYLRGRLDRPTARVAAGLALRGLASAAIDLSDGLAGDLSHILRASGVGAWVRAQDLPRSSAFEAGTSPADRLTLQAQGGDDYELCFTLPPARVDAARAALAVPLTVIGEVVADPGLRFVDAAGVTMPLNPHGYRHFA